MNDFAFYLLNKLAIGVAHYSGFKHRHLRWGYSRVVNAGFSIQTSMPSDFSFISREMENGRASGAFDSSAGALNWRRDAIFYYQFLSTIKCNLMVCSPHPIAKSFLMSAKIASQTIGFIWLKELQGFPYSGWEIYLLSVDEKHQRERVGTELLNSAISFIAELGHQNVFVRVKKTETSFIMEKFMARNGFNRTRGIVFENGMKMFEKRLPSRTR